MMLDPKKLTEKTGEIINAAVELAKEQAHATLAPLHLACALYDDPNGECCGIVSLPFTCVLTGVLGGAGTNEE
jgi:hypothetical protein